MTTILAFDAPQQVLLSGAMRGLAIGVFAVGIILIYRSNRVINFAAADLGVERLPLAGWSYVGIRRHTPTSVEYQQFPVSANQCHSTTCFR